MGEKGSKMMSKLPYPGHEQDRPDGGVLVHREVEACTVFLFFVLGGG